MNIEQKIGEYIGKHNKNEKLSINENYKFTFMYINEREHIVDVYIDEKLVIRANYEVLGCYNIINSIWIWSWCISYIEDDLTENPKKSAKHEYGILSQNKITKDVEEYLYYLSMQSFFISYKNLKKILRLGQYMTKSLFVLPHKIDDDKPIMIEFILIKKIIQEHD